MTDMTEIEKLVDAYRWAEQDAIQANDALPDIKDAAYRKADEARAALLAAIRGAVGWERLMDSDWMNIVNAPSVLELYAHLPMAYRHATEEAVNLAVKLTEARLKALNAAPPPVRAREGE